MPGVLEAMVKVPDLWSLAAMLALSVRLGRRVGGSTGTNLVAALACARALAARGEPGAVVTPLCDEGERYSSTYFDDGWLQAHGLDCGPERDAVDALLQRGEWPDALRRTWRLAGDLA